MMMFAVSRPAMAAVAAFGLAAALPCPPAGAQDGWNPFAEQTGIAPRPRRESKSETKIEAEPARPFLPSMSGEPGRGRGEPAASPSATSQSGFDQFGARGNQHPPAAGQPLPDRRAPATYGPREAVERVDLAPLPEPGSAAATGPALTAPGRSPGRGTAAVDAQAIERLLTGIEMPNRSRAVTELALVLFAGEASPLGGESDGLVALRAGALYRAGRIEEALAVLPGSDKAGRAQVQVSALVAAHSARVMLATGDRDRACASAKAANQARADLPAPARPEISMVQGYCLAADGNVAAAGLAAGLAREDRAASADTLAALDAVSAGEPPNLASAKTISLLDWRLAQLIKPEPGAIPVERADPALLAVLARGEDVAPRLRLEAAEAAARLNIIDAQALAAIYRQQSFTTPDLEQALNARADAGSRRALLFRAAEAERTPLKKTRLVRAALDDARRVGLYVPLAAALARTVEEVQPVAEIGWFAETAIEVMLAGQRFDAARRWSRFSAQPGVASDRLAGSLSHWAALIDIADPTQAGERGAALGSVEDIVLRGRFNAEALHRLASVLDALDYNVPHRLWEAASRTPQPNSGFLPPTGALAELQEAAKAKDQVRTIPLVLRALGPNGPEGAHMIALGDAIRGLRRAGLESHARAVAFEALFALWPRASSS